ncbi:MAG: hypothetical protein RIT25_3019 [Planctomycetota bacterium]|jgi:predicted AlkP superfamily phosphohydrolase/phosphomutase
MFNVLAHLTPMETPLVWLALLTGVALGSLGTLLAMRRRGTKG